MIIIINNNIIILVFIGVLDLDQDQGNDVWVPRADACGPNNNYTRPSSRPLARSGTHGCPGPGCTRCFLVNMVFACLGWITTIFTVVNKDLMHKGEDHQVKDQEDKIKVKDHGQDITIKDLDF